MEVVMASIIKHDTNSMVRAIYPGVKALVDAEIQKIIEEHIAVILQDIKTRVTNEVSLRVADILERDGTDVHMDCTVKVEER